MPSRHVLVAVLCLVLSAPDVAQEALRAPEALRVFPNPVTRSGAVTVEVEQPERATAEVFSMLGRRVDLSRPLAAGAYAVRVRDAQGQLRNVPLTLAQSATIHLQVRASGVRRARVVPDASGPAKAGPRLMFVHVIGDSHAAGKGDAAATCDLRPDADRKGWVYRRSFDDFVPACSPEADELFNGSVLPSLVDEVYDRLGITPLVVFYTVKGSRVGPEGEDNDVYWFPGDEDEAQSVHYTQAQLTFKRARLDALNQFGFVPDTLATVVSLGAVDTRLYADTGTPDPVTQFSPRLTVLNDSLTASGVPAYYFEIMEAPNKPEFNAARPLFQQRMDAVLPVDRITTHSDAVWESHFDSGFPADPALWYADRAGHLGALGLDLLGERLVDLIEFDRRVRRRVACLPGAPCGPRVAEAPEAIRTP
ncbi:MAG: T9SS type A sorting domain-containing protein [Bacteroidota bacterium]